MPRYKGGPIPARPRVNLDPVARAWQDVPASSIEVDDIVADAGKVVAVASLTSTGFENYSRVKIEFLSGASAIFEADETLFTFTRKR